MRLNSVLSFDASTNYGIVKEAWYEHCNGWTKEEEEIKPVPEELMELVVNHNKQKNIGWQNLKRYPIDVPFDHQFFVTKLKKNGNYYDDKLLEAKIYVVSE